MHLTVIHPFGSYKRGDKISDPALISEILEPHAETNAPHDNVKHVVRTHGDHETEESAN